MGVYENNIKDSLEEIINYLSQEILSVENSLKIIILEINGSIANLEHKSEDKYLQALEKEKLE